jgi:RNA polymerase sigma factor (sigma-70 family)
LTVSGLHLIIESPSRARLRFASDQRLVRLVRDGDRAAFEAIYDRHSAALLSFCTYMLGSHHDAEDALQATFSSAHRSLLYDDRELALRPWLFVIARNACLSIIRKRHAWVELNAEPAREGDPVRSLEVREEVRHLLDGLLALPEPQRAALVLAEMEGLSQREVSDVMGVRTAQVKAYTYQARSNLIAERAARDTDCEDIREELASAGGIDRRRSRLRRHLRTCEGCREFERGLHKQRRQLGALFPIVPSLALRSRALQDAFAGASAPLAYRGSAAAVGAGAAGTAALAGGGFKAIVATIAGVACVGACGVGASLLVTSERAPTHTTSSSAARGSKTGISRDVAAAGGPVTVSSGSRPLLAGRTRTGAGTVGGRGIAPGSPEGPAVEGAPGTSSPGGSGPRTDSGGNLPRAEREPGHQGTPHESNGASGTKRQQASKEQVQAAEQRKKLRETGKVARGEKQEQNKKSREQQKLEHKKSREQQKLEREEHERSLHGLPPELRKAERKKQQEERAKRKAEREEEKAP